MSETQVNDCQRKRKLYRESVERDSTFEMLSASRTNEMMDACVIQSEENGDWQSVN